MIVSYTTERLPTTDMKRKNRIWELVGRKTSGEINESEARKLDELLNEEDQGVQYMMNVMDHYWESVNRAPEHPGLTKRAEQHKSRVVEGLTTRDQLHRILFVSELTAKNVWLWAAASIIFILGGWFLYHSFNFSGTETTIVATKSGSRTKVTLPDGTQVWLNADSRLTYPNDFTHIPRREVTLSGEAYFEVKHDERHPFIIHTKYFNIEDVGTAFNVKAYPEDDESEATLVSGSIAVSLRSDPGKNLLLKPGEKVLYYTSDREMRTQENDNPHKWPQNNKIQSLKCDPTLEVAHIKPMVIAKGDTVVTETAWMNNQLVFNSQRFSELAKRLSRWYNVEMVIRDDQVENYMFTGIFEGETIEQALKELQMIRPFSFSIEKDKVIIGKPLSL